MWLFTCYGFFSAVCARQGEGSYGKPVDPNKVMVRARRREHLADLLDRFGNLFPDTPAIHETRSTDYRYRIFIPKSAWAEMVKALVLELNYDNFKNAAHAQLDGTAEGRAYTHALSDVWQVMADLQD